MNINLYEKKTHGNRDYRFVIYNNCCNLPFSCPLHYHKEIEMIMIIKGEMTVCISNKEYIGHKGDLFIVNSEELHEMKSKGNFEYCVIIFPISFLFMDVNDVTMQNFLIPLNEKRFLLPTTIDNEKIKEELISEIKLMRELHHEKSPINRLGIRVHLLNFMYILIKNSLLKENHEESSNSEINKKIISYINDHFNKNINLEMVSNEFGMSYKYFSRYFKNNFNTTLSNYILEMRMEKAIHLLTESTEPITDVAIECGYDNISFFIRTFKKLYGMAPLQYRNQNRK